MQFIPDTIDALSRLYDKTGSGGFVVLAGVLGIFLLVVAIALILIRQGGNIVSAVREYLQTQQAANVALGSIATSNEQIAAASKESKVLLEEVRDRVGKLPSDAPTKCKAPSPEEFVVMVREALRGRELTPDEISKVASAMAAKKV